MGLGFCYRQTQAGQGFQLITLDERERRITCLMLFLQSLHHLLIINMNSAQTTDAQA